jgi:hypothetical protein
MHNAEEMPTEVKSPLDYPSSAAENDGDNRRDFRVWPPCVLAL